MQEKKKPGRPRKEPTKILHFRVPVSKADSIKEQIMKLLKKLLPILLLLAASCTKNLPEPEPFVKVTISQGGESVMVRGYLQQPKGKDSTWVYLVQTVECGVKHIREVRIKAGEVYGELHYQTSCKVEPNWTIVYDDILRQ